MKRLVIITFIVILCLGWIDSFGQDATYYPKGDPAKWKVQLNPFVWLPVVSGTFASDMVIEGNSVPAVDLVSNLKFAFMFNGDVSKGKFFASPSYIYTKLGTEKLATKNGYDTISGEPELTMNIIELIAGMRFDIAEKVYMDPFIGFRYTNYHAFAELEGSLMGSTKTIDQTTDYWDPIIGLRVHYYPHPRVPLTFKSDLGGFGAGSSLSWTVAINGGYTLSPTIDLMAGFVAYGSDFVKQNALGNDVGLQMALYGFDVGIKIMIPARYKDPLLFPKKKKKEKSAY